MGVTERMSAYAFMVWIATISIGLMRREHREEAS
jgi:hypothetical protein